MNSIKQRVAFFLKQFVKGLVRSLYDIRVEGSANEPQSGGVLVIANHVSYMDALVLQAAFMRRLRFMGGSFLKSWPFMNVIMDVASVIAVDPRKPRAALESAAKALQEGECVVIFPEGKLTCDGRVGVFMRGFERIAALGNAPVLPVCIDGLWGSRLSFSTPFTAPSRGRRQVTVWIGTAMNSENFSAEAARSFIMDRGAESFAHRDVLKESLGELALRNLARSRNRIVCIDTGPGGRSLKGAELATVSILLSKHLRKVCPEERVGILLPPGAGGVIVNLACVLAGKTPVNINYTLGRASVESCFRQAGIQRIITAGKVQEMLKERFPDFPWPPELIDIREALVNLPKNERIQTFLEAQILPSGWFARRHSRFSRKGRDEAAVLFTSGSDSEPKGVVLSHRNLIANTLQIVESGVIGAETRLLGNLPIFHSFGFTVQVWTPLMFPSTAIYAPSPLDFRQTAEAVQSTQATMLIGTPTFLRPYLKKTAPEQLKSLRGVVAGAEKTPEGFQEAWEERFPDCAYLEGYGLTETTPVVSVNLWDTPSSEKLPQGHVRRRKGTVGKLFTGMAAKVIDPETGADLPLGSTGVLCLKGANVFEGYLNRPDLTASVMLPPEEGLTCPWLKTGDLASIDAEGFLTIQGRLSRFSKIAGEMVPHLGVEQAVSKAFAADESAGLQFAVASRPDEAKGEALVLLTTQEIGLADVQSRLREAGLPNLWIPKTVIRVDAIPVLATGKMDLKAVRKLAREA